MRTIPELLKEHVDLEVECIDRFYLNGYIPSLQRSGGLNYFMEKHRGQMIGSPAVLGEITRSFCSGIPRVNALSSNRIVWGFWLVVQSVIVSEKASHCATAARGSIALGTRRWLMSSSSTT